MSRPQYGYRLASGERVDGVTSILKTLGYSTDALVGWSNKIGREGLKQSDVLKHAGRVGTCMHDQLESILTNKLFDESKWSSVELEDAGPCVESFREWRKGKRIKVVTMELSMVSERLKCGGTLDLVARVNGGPLTLFDFKSSSHIYETHIAQVAAYLELLEDVHNRVITNATILRLGKDGDCEELNLSGEMLERGRRLFHIARELKAMEPLLKADLAQATRIVGSTPMIVELPTLATKEVNIA